MNNLVVFTPKFDLDARQNLEDFMSFSEKLPPLNERLSRDSAYWTGAVNFTKINVSAKNRDPRLLLDESLMRFAKAYVTYSQTLNPAKTFNEMKALRAIEHVMLRNYGTVNILDLNPSI